MSLNKFKPKSFNNFFSKLTKTSRDVINNNKKPLKKFHKDFIEKEGLLNYFKSFITPRRSTINENSLFFSNKKTNNYVTIIKSKNVTKSPYLSIKNITHKRKNYDGGDKNKIFFRNDNDDNTFKDNLLNKNNSHSLFSFKYINNYKEYIDKMENNFSPKNRYKVMKIYQSLHKNISPPLTKEIDSGNINDFEKIKHFNREFNHIRNKKNFIDEKNKSRKINGMNIDKKKNEPIILSIENVNSIQISNKKKKSFENKESIIKKDIIIRDENKQMLKPVLEENHEHKNNDVLKQNNEGYKIEYTYPETIKLYDVLQKNIKNKIKTKISNNNNDDKTTSYNDDNKNYNKINIMENCLNQLYFDYSDGNYNSPKNYNYLSENNQKNNKIISKIR